MYITHNKKEANFLLRFTVAPKSYNLKISRHCPILQTTTYYIINNNLDVLRAFEHTCELDSYPDE